MKYSSIIILSLAVFFVACHTDKQPVPPVSHSQSGKNLYDMSRADSFSCVSAMVINMNRPYQAKNYQAPPIAVLNNDTAVIVALGREQVVLKRQENDSSQYVYKRGDDVALVAFRNKDTHLVDTVFVSGKQGSGQTIMTYARQQR